MALFSQEPYEQVTVRRVAAAAGVTSGALFHQFATKADLWRAVMGTVPPLDHPARRSVGEIEAALRALVAACRDGDPNALARALAKAEAILAKLPSDNAVAAHRRRSARHDG
ncbi:helix-turn-helix domain-containing protein [Brevundimonas bacteroides]|uniref:helix-turn-helix domain-containing protein n=1 Tax=Brevundimonas bacteroides TaxID=74311 RepID=UPI0004953AD6|nr:helix-turn-helix domain-containing protein [Brevundimonas bacteroides]